MLNDIDHLELAIQEKRTSTIEAVDGKSEVSNGQKMTILGLSL